MGASQGLEQDGFQVGLAQGDGVALHAARDQRLGGDVVGLPRFEAEGGQAGHVKQGQRLADPGQAVLDGRGGLPGQQPGRLGVPVQDADGGGRGPRARTLASMTGARSAAQAIPCGTSAVPPMTPARPWTAPSFALASAIPPSRLHRAMSVRAWISEPSA